MRHIENYQGKSTLNTVIIGYTSRGWKKKKKFRGRRSQWISGSSSFHWGRKYHENGKKDAYPWSQIILISSFAVNNWMLLHFCFWKFPQSCGLAECRGTCSWYSSKLEAVLGDNRTMRSVWGRRGGPEPALIAENRKEAQVCAGLWKQHSDWGCWRGSTWGQVLGSHKCREVLQDWPPWCSAAVLLLGWKSWRQQKLCSWW